MSKYKTPEELIHDHINNLTLTRSYTFSISKSEDISKAISEFTAYLDRKPCTCNIQMRSNGTQSAADFNAGRSVIGLSSVVSNILAADSATDQRDALLSAKTDSSNKEAGLYGHDNPLSNGSSAARAFNGRLDEHIAKGGMFFDYHIPGGTATQEGNYVPNTQKAGGIKNSRLSDLTFGLIDEHGNVGRPPLGDPDSNLPGSVGGADKTARGLGAVVQNKPVTEITDREKFLTDLRLRALLSTNNSTYVGDALESAEKIYQFLIKDIK